MEVTVEDVVEAVDLVAAAGLDEVAALAIVNMETTMLLGDGVARVVVIINKATTIAIVTMRTTPPTLPTITTTAVPLKVNNQLLRRRFPKTDRTMAHQPVQPLRPIHRW